MKTCDLVIAGMDGDCEGTDELARCISCSNTDEIVIFFYCVTCYKFCLLPPTPTPRLNVVNCPGFCLLKTL